MWVWAVSCSSWETASGSFGLYFFQRKNIFHFQNDWKFPLGSSHFFFFLYTPVVCVGKHIQVYFYFAYNLFALFSVMVLWWLWVCWVFCNPATIRFLSLCVGVLLQGMCFLTKVTFQWRFCGETQLLKHLLHLYLLVLYLFYPFICGRSRNFPGI